MNYKKSEKYKYFAATVNGEMPTVHKFDAEAVLKDMAVCRKGWPDKKWTLFRIAFETDKETKIKYFHRLDIQVERFWQAFMVPSLLMDELLLKYPRKVFGKEAVPQ